MSLMNEYEIIYETNILQKERVYLLEFKDFIEYAGENGIGIDDVVVSNFQDKIGFMRMYLNFISHNLRHKRIYEHNAFMKERYEFYKEAALEIRSRICARICGEM